MSGLAQSNMTLNFSQASAGPIEQLKTRVLEAAVMGCIVLTDDLDRTRRFFEPELEFGNFANPRELAEVVKRFMSDPAKLAAAQQAAKQRARSINVTSFWGGVEEGLRLRGLPAFKS
jgi:spore maturation protein CgeB